MTERFHKYNDVVKIIKKLNLLDTSYIPETSLSALYTLSY